MSRIAKKSKKIEVELVGERGGKVKLFVEFPDDNDLIIDLKNQDSTKEWVKTYRALLLEEHYNNRKNERSDRHVSLDSFTYEDKDYFDSGYDQERDFIERETYEELLEPLSERQKYLIQKCIIENISYSELARQEGKDESAIRKAVKRALEKIKKNLI